MPKPLWEQIFPPDVELPPPKWELYTTLRTNGENIVQGVCADADNNLYVTQEIGGGPDPHFDLRVTQYLKGSTSPGKYMSVIDGYHGDRLYWRGGKQPIGLYLNTHGKYVALPWEPGRTWARAEVVKPLYVRDNPVIHTYRDKTTSFQGECDHGNLLGRLYGSPQYAADGYHAPFARIHFEVIRNSDDGLKYTFDTINMDGVGTKNGKPINGKREPEGVSKIKLNGEWYWLVGMSIGKRGNYQHQIWVRRIV